MSRLISSNTDGYANMIRKSSFINLSLLIFIIIPLIFIFASCADTNENSDAFNIDGLVTIDVDISEYLENGTVKCTMHNNSTGDFSYTEGYSLFYLNSGTWYEVPFVDPYFSELTQTLASGDSISTYEYFTERLGDLPAGTYLLTRSGELRIPENSGDDGQRYFYKLSASGTFELPKRSGNNSEV